MPICIRCGEEKDISKFRREKGIVLRSCKTCRYRARAPWRKEHREEELEYQRQWQQKFRQKVKLDILDHYGRICCWCCESDVNVLQIDHINNDGNKHRRLLSRGRNTSSGVYRWIRKQDYPPGFQVLCANCNWAKSINRGILPQNRYHLHVASVIPVKV
jgi:hypothetical protein